LHIDPRFGEPREMVFPKLWVDEVEGLVTVVETVRDERVEHAVLLVDAVEERADVTMPADGASGNLYGMLVGFHTSPST
jgi:predicted methyltransferase MtxX (methanogen marker protein 4)